MSTADSYLIVSVQTCVHDIYKAFNPNISEKKELRLTRVFAVILPLGALVIALYIKNAYSILMFAWSFYAAAAGRLEAGGGALRPRAYGPRRHCLRCCIGWSQSGYLSEGTDPLSGPLSERGGPLNG